MFRSAVIVLFLSSLASLASAQPGGQNLIGVSFGGSDFHIVDQHASPLIFRGIGIAPSLEFFYGGETVRHEIEGAYYSGSLEATNGNFHTDNWRGKFRYAYSLKAAEFGFLGGEWRVFAGGALESFFCKSEYWFDLSGHYAGRSIVSWYWRHSLDLAGRLECSLSPEESASLSFSFPLLSNVSRPGYSPSSDYNYNENDWKMHVFGREILFLKNPGCSVRLAYERFLVPELAVRAQYEFLVNEFDNPAEVHLYMNNLRIGVLYAF